MSDIAGYKTLHIEPKCCGNCRHRYPSTGECTNPGASKAGIICCRREMPKMGGRAEMIEWIIIGPDGKPKMSTTHAECLPPPEILRQMKKAGYKIKTTERKP